MKKSIHNATASRVVLPVAITWISAPAAGESMRVVYKSLSIVIISWLAVVIVFEAIDYVVYLL